MINKQLQPTCGHIFKLATLIQRRSKAKTWQMVKIVWSDSAIEDLNAI